jgi:hypothetical protein
MASDLIVFAAELRELAAKWRGRLSFQPDLRESDPAEYNRQVRAAYDLEGSLSQIEDRILEIGRRPARDLAIECALLGLEVSALSLVREGEKEDDDGE